MNNIIYRPTRLTTDEFIKRAKLIHDNKYNYSLVEYTNGKTKVKIICSKHGVFEQNLISHIHKKQGCPKCEHDKRRLAPIIFLDKAKKIHGDKYNYSQVDYKSVNHKVIIECPIHGYFKMSPRNHLRTHGCAKCGNSKGIYNIWTHTGWEQLGNNSKNFDGFKVYIIKCFNDDEEFYKIGKTFTTISKRYISHRDMPYMYEIIKVIHGESKQISNLEVKLHKKYKIFKYSPKLEFPGKNECFNININI